MTHCSNRLVDRYLQRVDSFTTHRLSLQFLGILRAFEEDCRERCLTMGMAMFPDASLMKFSSRVGKVRLRYEQTRKKFIQAILPGTKG